MTSSAGLERWVFDASIPFLILIMAAMLTALVVVLARGGRRVRNAGAGERSPQETARAI